jgi:dihydrofolate synthase/folylpolyglutamate synthase
MADERAGLEYLRTFPDFERDAASASQAFGLDRVLALIGEVGSPQLRMTILHIAGTKGKGSTAAMLAAILRAAGYRTGLFTSPHLLRLHERFQIDGSPITDGEINTVMLERVRPAVERLAQRGIHGVQQFEAQVALALLWFKERGAQVVVLETGLGGRLDATNVTPRPLATVLTPIGFDHMQILGDTLPLIAAEKAAIIKDGVPAVASPQPPEAAQVFIETCALRQAPLLLGGRDWWVHPTVLDTHGTRFTLAVHAPSLLAVTPAASAFWQNRLAVSGPILEDLHTTLLGAHQAVNAGAAIITAMVSSARLPWINEQAVRSGLAAVQWPGRLQIVWKPVPIVLDGAHTAESSAALAEAVRALFPERRFILVCGVQSDKDIPAVVRPLAALAEAAVATQASHPRAAPPEVVWTALQAAGCPQVQVAATPSEALQRALALATPDAVVLVTGSLYLVGDILTVLDDVHV